MMPRSVALVVLVVLAGCTSGGELSPNSTATTGPTETSPSATGSMVPIAPPPSSAASASAIGGLDCQADTRVTGIIDYASGATGVDDVAAGTEAFPGVREADEVVVDGAESAVVRDGETIFVFHWREATAGGWLLDSYDACQDPDSTPTAQTGTAIGEVAADGVRVRSMPTVHPASIKYVPLLRSGDRVLVAAGPVAADGYDWFLVDTLYESGERPLFGWAAFESRDGETWIAEDDDVDCPAIPRDARQLGVTNDDVLLHCFGSRDLSFELDTTLYCSPDHPAIVEHDWLALDCTSLSGDACGTCGLRIAAHPDADVELPDRDSGRWAMTGHFDDPAAASCAKGQDAEDGLLAEWAVHYCRTTFVLTALERQ